MGVNMLETATSLLWTVIFAVKLSFLFLFRTLLKRVKYLKIWWWCVFIVLILSAGVYISILPLDCMKSDKGQAGKSKTIIASRAV